MTELKCLNCRETFVRNVSVAIAKFCPYCGSTSLSIVVKEAKGVPDVRDEYSKITVREAIATEQEKPRPKPIKR